MNQKTQIHGTCITIDDNAVVLLGPPGSGKSDLALRLIDHGATLIADDRIDIQRDEEKLIAMSPQNLAGLIEVRGIGIVRIDHRESGFITMAFELTFSEHIERMPEPSKYELLGVSVPCFKLDPFSASACAKVRLCVKAIDQDLILKP